ncbi:O-antigen polysaccharide polymerase Wzy [Photobacterium toruni]|uniref:O-antigen polysaccharide polymerase Wzy n=1 Tax=Photobacterium toruni TaxID=1935446 RepID=A0A1T4N7Z6_9GAMM|nr:O-antigen polysaccharide polymerase Wzy [Photobacterium toruni]SJZ75354.1 hypothetical protein CZ814_00604 [Photobacterium toruni]
MRNKSHLFVIYTLLISLVIFYLISNTYHISNFNLSIFVCFYILSTIVSRVILQNENFFSFYSLYYLTFVIFMCGSFIMYPFMNESLHCRDMYGPICFSTNEIIKSIFYVLSGSSAIEIGYYCYKNKNVSYENIDNRKIYIICVLILCFIYPVLMYSTINMVINTFNYGYLAAYTNSQAGQYSTPLNLICLLIINVGLGLSFVIKDKKRKFFNFYFSLFFINALVSGLSGGRSGFISAIFLFLWICYGDKKNNLTLIFKMIIYAISLLFSLNILMYLTGRSESLNLNVFGFFIKLIDAQGITFFVYALSSQVESYPFVAYIKTIIPGFIHLYSSFIGNIAVYLTGFPQYLSWSTDSSLFNKGYGLGWSLFSDFYVYSFGFFPLFFGLALFWGRWLAFISQSSKFHQGLLVCIITTLFIINRGSVSVLIPYVLLYVLLFKYIARIKLRK